MNKFDKIFAEAVESLLTEDREQGRKPAIEMIQWSPGSGNWSGVIKGIAKEAKVPYSEVVQKSAASGSKGAALMAKLGVVNQSRSSNSSHAAAEIIKQSLSNDAMSELYGEPKLGNGFAIIPVKLPMDDESIEEGEGIRPRNATVFVHLTLLGAYNASAKYLNIDSPIKISTANNGQIVIKNV